MEKYLVKKIKEMETVTVDGRTVTQETGNVTYQVLMKTNGKHKPRGGEFLFLESDVPMNAAVVSTDGEGKLILIEDPAKLLQAAVTVKYKEMVTDVYAEMATVFGTTNDVSASASAATFEAMKKRPANYVDVDLGLADEAAVTAYADSKLAASDAYGVFRMKRIGQYQAEKAVILGE